MGLFLFIFLVAYLLIFLTTCFYYQLENRLTKEKARKSVLLPFLFFLGILFFVLEIFFFLVKIIILVFGFEYRRPSFMETFEENLFFKWM